MSVDNYQPDLHQFPEPASIRIRQMNVGDLPLCRNLVQQAGWNQHDSDWLRAMQLEPYGCFVAETDGLPVGTTTTSVFGSTGWIAMVLVDERARKFGIGKKLLLHAITYLQQKSVSTIRLDATALGQRLYTKLGFLEEYEVVRYVGHVTPCDFNQSGLHQINASEADVVEIGKLDRKITATDRTPFIKTLINEVLPAYKYLADNIITGYACCREGKNAVQIGPIISQTAETGHVLIQAVTNHFATRKIFLDVPVPNVAAISWAEKNGLTEQRRFVRMYRGEKISDHPQFIWASAGPEKG